jgi:hypothetical protein
VPEEDGVNHVSLRMTYPRSKHVGPLDIQNVLSTHSCVSTDTNFVYYNAYISYILQSYSFCFPHNTHNFMLLLLGLTNALKQTYMSIYIYIYIYG